MTGRNKRRSKWPIRRPRLPASIRKSRRGRGTVWGALAASFLAALLGYDHWTHNQAGPVGSDDFSRYHQRTFRVVQVVDGDTLDIDCPDGGKPVTRIRLWGVDTPEVSHGGQPAMYFGAEALTFAEGMVEGHDVLLSLEPDSTRDRFGRLLAFVHPATGGESLNETLLDAGLAYADPRFPHSRRDEFLAAEIAARRESRGLWAGVDASQMPNWRQRESRKTRKQKDVESMADGE